MVWNAGRPTSNEKIRNLSEAIIPNWQAIEEGNLGLTYKALPMLKRDAVVPITPGAIANSGILFTKSAGTPSKVELFYENDAGAVTQLTSGSASIAANGYTFLPGGAILQWGTATLATQTTVVTLPLAYPTAILSVVVSLKENSAQVTHCNWGNPTAAPPITAFTIYRESVGNSKTATWIAIGH